MHSAAGLLQALKAYDADVRARLRDVYGNNQDVLAERAELLRRVLEVFAARHGPNRAVRLFRSPARINLRGMHVDTHGGYLNLMTHQREVVVAAAVREDTRCTAANIVPQFAPAEFGLGKWRGSGAFAQDWLQFIEAPAVRAHISELPDGWARYIEGAALSAQHAHPDTPFLGIDAVVGSDIPVGAALSSSHALSLAFLLAVLGWNSAELDTESRILAVRNAEWYAGARTGTSDQGAMILGRRGELVNVALFAEQLDTSETRYLALPDDLAVLVINSYTERSLSGRQLAEYTRNRFAYSMALEILRQEIREMGGCGDEAVGRMDRLARITPEALGGLDKLYTVLQAVPESLAVEELRSRYDLPEFDLAWQRYFGGVPVENWPRTIGLRGPLLFGIAESERARLFLPMLRDGNYRRAGLLMKVGHDGDRIAWRAAQEAVAATDTAMAGWRREGRPIELCPGDYGASSPVLDGLVDKAVDAGALGACLTGGGIAGAVLALCMRQDAHEVTERMRAWLASGKYARLAGRESPLAEHMLAEAVVENHAPAAAGELCLLGQVDRRRNRKECSSDS